MDEPPPAYTALWNDETERDWDKLLAKHGYERKGTIGGEFSLIDVTIWQHRDGHVLVDHHVAAGWSIVLFIRPDDVGAWSLDGYLKLAPAYAQAEQAAALSRLSKSIIAFIRHGHGEETIDEFGVKNTVSNRKKDKPRIGSRNIFCNKNSHLSPRSGIEVGCEVGAEVDCEGDQLAILGLRPDLELLRRFIVVPGPDVPRGVHGLRARVHFVSLRHLGLQLRCMRVLGFVDDQPLVGFPPKEGQINTTQTEDRERVTKLPDGHGAPRRSDQLQIARIIFAFEPFSYLVQRALHGCGVVLITGVAVVECHFLVPS